MRVDHDFQFKNLLRSPRVLRDFFALFLPDAAPFVDFDHIQFLDKELSTLRGRRRTGDLLIKTRFKGSPAAFLIHLEHQAQPDPHLPQRMLEYFALDCRHFELPVYPVAVLTHRAPPPGHLSPVEVDFPNKRVLSFDFDVIDLVRLDAIGYLSVPNLAGLALSSRMRLEVEHNAAMVVRFLRSLVECDPSDAERELIAGYYLTYRDVAEEDTLKIEAELGKVLSPEEREEVMSSVNPWVRRGRTEGRLEGRRIEALELILRQLRRRFGLSVASSEEAVRALPLEQLESLGEALLDFRSPDDLSTWLSAAK